jgi:predicted ribonuclease YlaK
MTPNQARDLERYLTPAEREELNVLIAADIQQHRWRPLPGPQTMAYTSEADVIGFGGAAGGGKTDLAIGMAITQHYRTQVFRREGPQLKGIIDRLAEIMASRQDINGNPPVYRDNDDRQIEFNSMPNLGDETKYQGRPKDLLVIDEAANFLEQQVRFVKGWVRTTRPGQRTRTLLTFNPPTTAEGR